MKNKIILFYIIFIICGALSLSFVPGVMNYGSGSMISIIIIGLPLIYSLVKNYGWRLCVKSVVIMSIFAMCIEYIGLVTGFPYSEFMYTGNLGYKISGILPITIGLSWTPLMIGAIGISYFITKIKILRIILPVIILVIFDLVLDPSAVAIGMWEFMNPGRYYNIPVQNFIGWIISGSIGSIIGYYIFKNQDMRKVFTLSYSFFISIVFWTLVSTFKGLIIPAIIGYIMIAIYIVLHYKNEKISSNQQA